MVQVEQFEFGTVPVPHYVSSDFLPLQKSLLQQRGFELIPIQSYPCEHIAVLLPSDQLTVVPWHEVHAGIDDVLQSQSREHLRRIDSVEPFIGSAALYEEVLRKVEIEHPGTLRRLFLIDPNGWRGLSGYYWLATSDRVALPDPINGGEAEHMVMLAAHNGRDFSTALRRINSTSTDIKVLPLVAPRRFVR